MFKPKETLKHGHVIDGLVEYRAFCGILAGLFENQCLKTVKVPRKIIYKVVELDAFLLGVAFGAEIRKDLEGR